MDSIHISDARRMLARKERVKISFVTKKGHLETFDDAAPIGVNFYAGTRNFKLPNGEIRCVRDSLIVALNDKEVFLGPQIGREVHKEVFL